MALSSGVPVALAKRRVKVTSAAVIFTLTGSLAATEARKVAGAIKIRDRIAIVQEIDLALKIPSHRLLRQLPKLVLSYSRTNPKPKNTLLPQPLGW